MFSTGYRLIQWIALSTFGQLVPEFQFFMSLCCKFSVLPRSIFPFERISDGARGKREVLSLVARVGHAIPKPRSKSPL